MIANLAAKPNHNHCMLPYNFPIHICKCEAILFVVQMWDELVMLRQQLASVLLRLTRGALHGADGFTAWCKCWAFSWVGLTICCSHSADGIMGNSKGHSPQQTTAGQWRMMSKLCLKCAFDYTICIVYGCTSPYTILWHFNGFSMCTHFTYCHLFRQM